MFSLYGYGAGLNLLCLRRYLNWVILLIGHSALPYITHWAQRAALYYSLGTARCPILLIGHSALGDVTHPFLP